MGLRNVTIVGGVPDGLIIQYVVVLYVMCLTPAIGLVVSKGSNKAVEYLSTLLFNFPGVITWGEVRKQFF